MTTNEIVQMFRTQEPRKREPHSVLVECFAVPEMFAAEFAEMPQELQDAFSNGLSIPCEGGGVTGPWCSGCEFGAVHHLDSVDVMDFI